MLELPAGVCGDRCETSLIVHVQDLALMSLRTSASQLFELLQRSIIVECKLTTFGHLSLNSGLTRCSGCRLSGRRVVTVVTVP